MAEFQEKPAIQAFMLHDHDDELIVVAFRGTELFNEDDWSTDLDISCYKCDRIGKVHGGFMKALGLTRKGWPKELEQDDRRNLSAYL